MQQKWGPRPRARPLERGPGGQRAPGNFQLFFQLVDFQVLGAVAFHMFFSQLADFPCVFCGGRLVRTIVKKNIKNCIGWCSQNKGCISVRVMSIL